MLLASSPTVCYGHNRLLHRILSCRRVFSSPPSSFSDPSNDDVQSSPPSTKASLPIGVFIDLDNVAPSTHRRRDAKQFIHPLIQLGRLINNHEVLPPSSSTSLLESLDNSSIKQMQQTFQLEVTAFGNLATRSFKSTKQRSLTLQDQEYIPWTQDDNIAQTGYDAQADTIRCGICGFKVKLTKKKRDKYKRMGVLKEDIMLQRELRQHTKIHSQEQKKRLQKTTATGKKRLLGQKEMMRSRKYNSAMLGVTRGQMSGFDLRNGKAIMKNRNDLFQVLREIGVRVKSCNDVDNELVSTATEWMNRIRSCDDKDTTNIGNQGHNGVIVVYSKDSDFVPLLELARKYGFITISMTDQRVQTSKLLQASDIVIGKGLFSSLTKGTIDDFDDDDESIDSHDEVNDGLDRIEILVRGAFGTKANYSDDTTSENEDDSFEIRKLQKAPSLQFKTIANSSDKSVHATSVSDVGFEFMVARREVDPNNALNGMARWHLADESVHDDNDKEGPFDENGMAMIIPTPMSQLKNEHIRRDSPYFKRSNVRKRSKKKKINEHKKDKAKLQAQEATVVRE